MRKKSDIAPEQWVPSDFSLPPKEELDRLIEQVKNNEITRNEFRVAIGLKAIPGLDD